jgi:hypothetical protein
MQKYHGIMLSQTLYITSTEFGDKLDGLRLEYLC